MEIIFEKIHKSIIYSLGKETRSDEKVLFIIGQWFFNFLTTGEQHMRVSLPVYNEKLTRNTYLYLRSFSLIYNLLSKRELTNFKDTCLYDIPDHKTRNDSRIPHDCILRFCSEKNEILKWGNETITNKLNFLPVFNHEQIQNVQYLDSINNSFKLFKSIRKNKLMNYPILIDLEENILTLLNSNEFNPLKILKIKDEFYNSNDNLEDISEKADCLDKLDLNLQILIKFPYHRNIHTYLVRENVQTFEVNFNSRLYYDLNKLMPTDLILLPKEFNCTETNIVNNPRDFYLIFETDHDQKVYDLLDKLKTSWDYYDFNIYTTPFPKYWMMFITPIIPEEIWVELFVRNYPIVSQKPIMELFKQLIHELYNLNWVKKFIDDYEERIHFIFPEIKGANSKRLKLAYYYFESYIRSLRPLSTFSNECCNIRTKNNFILNGFDLLDSANTLQKNKKVRFLIPDFIYYSYNPWITFHIINYQKIALLNQIRQNLDRAFDKNKVDLNLITQAIVKDIREDITRYRSKYRLKEEQLIEPNQLKEDIILNNDEEIETYTQSEKQNTQVDVLIQTTDDKFIYIKSSDKIFVYRNSLINVNANQLLFGDLFFTFKDLETLISQNSFFDKLSDIPEGVKDFQSRLAKELRPYEALSNMGLKYAGGEQYFKKYYCQNIVDANSPLFQLPRKREYWKIICEYLGIESNDMSIAFISYYGRSRKNQIKDLYKSVLNFLVINNSIGKVEEINTFKGVTKIVEDHIEIFNQVEDFDLAEISKSILENIENEIFHIIKEVKNITR